MARGTDLGRPVGLTRTGVNITRIPPGMRTSFPHAHSDEEEFLYVLEGTPDVWLDGELHRLGPGDIVGFPPGTGVAHTVINDTSSDVKLFVVGEHRPGGDRVFYPRNPERNAQLDAARRWENPPRAAEQGSHDGLPAAIRGTSRD
jgi:uncharacterized cupin superfamily protein